MFITLREPQVVGEGPEHPACVPALPRQDDRRVKGNAARALARLARVHCHRRDRAQPRGRGHLRAAAARLQTRPPQVPGPGLCRGV